MSLASPGRAEGEKADPAADGETSDAPESRDTDRAERDERESEASGVLSEQRRWRDGASDPDADEEGEQDAELVSDMEKVALDDAFIEDGNSPDEGAEVGDEPPEPKEYTVVNQDPELAFRTLAARAAPEKQECSVHSSLLQFTEVETLTRSNSLLCVTCTKRRQNRDKAGGK